MDSIDTLLSSHYQEKEEKYSKEYNFSLETEKEARISDVANSTKNGVSSVVSPSTRVSLNASSHQDSFLFVFSSPKNRLELPEVRSNLSTPVKTSIQSTPERKFPAMVVQ